MSATASAGGLHRPAPPRGAPQRLRPLEVHANFLRARRLLQGCPRLYDDGNLRGVGQSLNLLDGCSQTRDGLHPFELLGADTDDVAHRLLARAQNSPIFRRDHEPESYRDVADVLRQRLGEQSTGDVAFFHRIHRERPTVPHEVSHTDRNRTPRGDASLRFFAPFVIFSVGNDRASHVRDGDGERPRAERFSFRSRPQIHRGFRGSL